MNDEAQPAEQSPPVFPQYQPPDPRGPQYAHRKQAAPLWKMVNKLIRPRTSQRPIKKPKMARRRKRDEV